MLSKYQIGLLGFGTVAGGVTTLSIALSSAKENSVNKETLNPKLTEKEGQDQEKLKSEKQEKNKSRSSRKGSKGKHPKTPRGKPTKKIQDTNRPPR